MKVCLGGTFHPFHIGHEALLRRAFEGASHVFVGVTSGELGKRDDREIPAWNQRAEAIRAFARAEGFAGELQVNELRDTDGPAATGDYDAIVVSPETLRGADAINARRRQSGLPLLQVFDVGLVLGQDRLPIHATQIASGDLDAQGRRLTPVRVAVGSANPVKVAAVEAAMARILALPVEVKGFPVNSGVAEQPRNAETDLGASNRARAAMAAWPCDFAVGIEAGLVEDPAGVAWFDAQACTILDRTGESTTGWGPAFQYPGWVTQRALDGEMISDILGPIANDPRIGGTTGAIGFLTDGLMDRTELTRVAVLMAMVPRLSSHYP